MSNFNKLLLFVIAFSVFYFMAFEAKAHWQYYISGLVLIWVATRKNLNLNVVAGILLLVSFFEALSDSFITAHLIKKVPILYSNGAVYTVAIFFSVLSVFLLKYRWEIMLRFAPFFAKDQQAYINKTGPCVADAPLITVYLILIVSTILTFIEHLLMNAHEFGASKEFVQFFRSHIFFYYSFDYVNIIGRSIMVAILVGAQIIYQHNLKNQLRNKAA
ncbi:hypothetical protein ACFOEE_17035 [Pseudoalteromonas fenneropenaei]|uniref:Uncharacterized protein n=1 Tax=Pseudoalteromonas fenneropenaei TaxID=1737459 RepID=A0ABV7CNG3_9GAMM